MPDEITRDTEEVEELETEEVEDQDLEEVEEVKEEPQEEMDRRINRIIARERTKTEKMLKKMFGTTDLNQAAEYYKAGQAVSQASGKKPHEVMQRIQQQTGQQGYIQNGGDSDLAREIQEVKGILANQHESELRGKQEVEAKKEFGKLYDNYQDDIEEVAEDRGLSLLDAAAIVLRPHLGKLYEQRTQDKQKAKRRKRVESSEDSPEKSGDNVSEQLSAPQKRVAQKMNLSYKEYYQQLKELGRI